MGPKRPGFSSGRFLACSAVVALAARMGTALASEVPVPELRAPEEHVTVQRVLLPVRTQVPWDHPRACEGLAPRDVRVFEDDRPVREVEEIEDGWRPTLHLVLLDVSGSMRAQRAFVRAAARRYLEKLEADERAAVFAVGDSLTMRAAISPDRARLQREVDAAEGETSTFLWDSIVELTRQFGDRPGRKALIVVSDGVDAGSLASYEDALAAVVSIPEFSVFAVVPAAPVPGTEDATVVGARDRMKALARATGGEFFLVADPTFLGRAFLDVRDLLRSEIFVHYVPPPDPDGDGEAGRVRRVRVDLERGRPGCRLLAARRSRRTGSRPPLSGVAAPAWTAIASRGPLLREAGCAGRPALRVEEGAIAACTIDAVLDHGFAWDPVLKTAFFRPEPRLAMRRVVFEVPPIERLPRSPAELVRRWLLDDAPADLPAHWVDDATRRAWGEALPERRSPLASGTAWLALRRRLGVAMREGFPEYDAWLRRGLALDAAEHVEVARRALAARGYGADAIEAEAAFRRLEAEAHVADPTAYDAQEGLAAWLGDVPARRLAFDVERLAIERWLESEAGEEEAARVVARWDRLHAWFPPPLERRVVVLPSPILDGPSGRIGFHRVVLPVPTLLADRAWAIKKRLPEIPRDDSVPQAPYALLLLRHLRSDPEYRDLVTSSGWTVRALHHAIAEPREPARRKRHRAQEDDAASEILQRVWIDLRGPAPGAEGMRIEAMARTAPDGTATFEAIAACPGPRDGAREGSPDADATRPTAPRDGSCSPHAPGRRSAPAS